MSRDELRQLLFRSDIQEALATYAHQSWSGWVDWMFARWDQTHASGESFRERWKRQITTPYSALSEDEKRSDQREALNIADAILRAVNADEQA